MSNANSTVYQNTTSLDAAGGIQRAPRPSSRYTCIHNDVLRDTRLSFRALGILVEILSRPDNWRTRSATLTAGRKEGRDAVRAALAELRDTGYLVHRKSRDERGRITTISTVYDTPQSADHAKPQVAPGPEKPTSGGLAVGKPGPLRSTETNTLEEVLEVEWSNSVERESGVEWSNAVGHANEDPQTVTIIKPEPELDDRPAFADWRTADRELFRAVVGDEITTDGSVWGPAGTFPADVWYDALRNHKTRPVDWPGRYVSQLADDGGLDNWLLAKGLDTWQPAA